ncbi:hypothetical protein EGK_02784 [Macaca mulatta]|uniref:Uncharacterized protein n=1 Tax=Macaca mulatta TaxID=9544 RepID=G7N387_MACMU|nr:hypothetical protein EGK_02784 [Macaca mulatta]
MCRCLLVILSVDHEVPLSSFFIGWRTEGRAWRPGRPDMADGSGWQRRSAEAQHSLCESERARVQAARKHILVWAPRQSPPPDWHLPLPQEKDE